MSTRTALHLATERGQDEALVEWLARERNREPLPAAPTSTGVQLPPQRLCLLKVCYQLEPRPPAASASVH